MAAAMVAVLSPAVSTCEPLSAAAVGAGAEPPTIGTAPPTPPSSGLSIAKLSGTVFKNTTSIIIKNNNNSSNNTITTTTTRRLKPNSSSSSSSSTNNGITVFSAASLSSSSATTNTTDSSPSLASFESPVTSSSSCVNITDTCEENSKKKRSKHSAAIPHISLATHSISRSATSASSLLSPSNLNRSVVIDKPSSIITANSIDDATDTANNITVCLGTLTTKTIATTTTNTNVASSSTETTTKAGTNTRATTQPPPFAPTIATTTTSIITSVVASPNSYNKNSLCNNSNNSSSSSSSSSSINLSSISTKTTNSTSIISTILKANGIIVPSSSAYPSLDISDSSSTTWITNGKINNNNNKVCLRTSASIVAAMGPEEEEKGQGYPEVSDQNNGTSVIITAATTTTTTTTTTNSTTTSVASATPLPTAVPVNVLGTTNVAADNSRRKPHNGCKGNNNNNNNNNETHTRQISLNNEHNNTKNNNNKHKKNNTTTNNNDDNNGIERFSFDIQNNTNTTNSGDDVSKSNNFNNNNNNNNNNNDNDNNRQSRDNKHCSLYFGMTCRSQRSYHADSDIIRRTVNKRDNCNGISIDNSSRTDSCHESTQNMREHDHHHRRHHHHINNNKNIDDDDHGAESTADDSDFDSPPSGADSFSCQAERSRTTTPSNNNNNTSSSSSSSSNDIASCSGSDNIVSSYITSTCATNSTVDLQNNTSGNNTRSSSNKSPIVTNGISASSLPSTTSSNNHIIVVPTFKSKTKCNILGTTKSNNYNNHANGNTNHDLDVADVNGNDGADAESGVLSSRIRLASKNGSNIDKVQILNNAISARATDHRQDNELHGGEETDYRKPHHRSRQNHTTTLSEKSNATPSPLVLTPPPPPPATRRKNKRKLSEPRKRTDFSIKRFCSNNEGEGVNNANYEEGGIAPTQKKVVQKIGGGVDGETSRFRLNDEEVHYVGVDEEGHRPLLSRPSRPPLVQFGHPSARILLEADMYCRSLGRMTPTAAGQSLFESSLAAMGESCSSSPTPLQLYQQRSRGDIDDEDDYDDDDDDEDNDDDLDEDLDPDDIDDEVAERTSARSTLRPLRVPLSHHRRHRRLSDGGVVRDEAGNMRSSRTGVIRNHETSISRQPVSTTAVTASSSETTNPGRGFSVNAPIHNAHTISAAAAAASSSPSSSSSSTSSVVPGSLSPFSSIPPPPHTLSPFTSHLNGFVHHHQHLHNHQIHDVAEEVVGGFESSGGVELDTDGGGGGGLSSGKKTRKNYKNMTRERRIEANARERSRVHTISAAFENLRRAVPSYSCNQKLSKLAILRIACCYILALARLADMDYSEEQNAISFDECVDMCTKTIQTEGRARRRH